LKQARIAHIEQSSEKRVTETKNSQIKGAAYKRSFSSATGFGLRKKADSSIMEDDTLAEKILLQSNKQK